MKYKIIAALLLWSALVNAQITKVGNDTLLDVAGWNVEWFGDASNGPSNDALQFTNVTAVIRQTDIDVWGLAEVSNTTTFSNLLTDLTDYDGVNSSFSQTQKMALIWKKSKFTLVSSGNVLTESANNYDFAGRPPLEVVLASKDNTVKDDTLYFYVVHLKANSGSADQSSYDRRKNAAVKLKAFLDQNRSGKKCIVLGDWNDDVDQSVVLIGSAYLATPFGNFVNDSMHYFFASMALSKAGENSYVSSQNMIDHQLMSSSLKDSFYVSGSSVVMKQTASQITGYSNNTSDHYPVLARYNFNRTLPIIPPPTGIQQASPSAFYVYPNPVNDYLAVESDMTIVTANLMGLTGNIVQLDMTTINRIDLSAVPSGLYVLVLETANGQQVVKRLCVQHD
jgi:exonuclease III